MPIKFGSVTPADSAEMLRWGSRELQEATAESILWECNREDIVRDQTGELFLKILTFRDHSNRGDKNGELARWFWKRHVGGLPTPARSVTFNPTAKIMYKEFFSSFEKECIEFRNRSSLPG